MENHPGNSHKSKEEPQEDKKIEKVVTGKVITRKPSLGKRFTGVFLDIDFKGVWSYVFLDVMIPAAKDMIVDAGSEALHRSFYGDSRPRNKRPGVGGAGGSYVSYNRYHSGTNRASNKPQSRDPREPRGMTNRGRANHSFEEIILESRGEAEDVIDRMYDILSRYDLVSVADFYEMVGIKASHTDRNWGWSSLQGSRAVRVPGGYLIDLPRPSNLD